MTNEDQVAALFAKANPVPSLDLLDPVEALDMEHLAHTSARSSEMTEVETYETKSEGSGRKPRVALVVAMAVVAVAAVGILVNNQSEFASPGSTATAFMDALADHDGNAALEILAPDARFNGLSPLSNLPLFLDLDRATGVDFMNQGCEERSTGSNGTFVDCGYVVEDEWTKALGLEPMSGNYEILIDEGQIQVAVKEDFSDESVEDPWITFRNWVKANHPDDMATMYIGEGGAHLNPESIALFEQYTDEFVAYIESGAFPSVSIATAFMNAQAAHDGNAALEMLAPDARYEGLSPLSNLPLAFDLDRAIGVNLMIQGCVEKSTGPDGILVDCPFIGHNDWARALGLAPRSETYEILVAEGQIQSAVRPQGEDVPGIEDPWITFRNWVEDNHPEDFETMYNGEGGARLDPESIALFEQYTDEFVASLED